MRRALWFGAVLLAVAGVQCTSSSENENPGGDTSLEGGVVQDGGNVDESGSGDAAPPDKTAPTFAGVKTVTALSETQLGVTWDPATDDRTAQGTIAYRIYVADKSGGETFSAPVVTAPAGSTGATIAALHANKKYFVVVRAVDGAGNEDQNVVEASATTMDTEAPTFGGTKTVVGKGAHEVEVSWDPATDNGSDSAGIHYEVFASATQGGENFASPSLVTAGGATSAIVTGLPEAVPIFVIVRAVDEAGNHDANKHEIGGFTLDGSAPAFAGLSSATAVGTTINLGWSDATDNVDAKEAIKYDIFQSTTPGGENFTTPTFTTAPGATSFAVNNLAVSTTYYFVVRAHDSADNVDANLVEKSAKTAASPDVKAPTFAGVATAAATTDQTIDLSWTAATDDYSAAAQIVYDIYIANTPGGETFSAPSFTTAPGATNFTVTGLAPSTKSYFVVRARDEAGNEDKNVVEKSATTLADTIPPTFAGLAGATAISPTSVQLTWNAASDDVSGSGTIKYRVYQGASAGGENFASPVANVAAGQTSVILSSLAPNTKYFYVVRAVDEAGNVDGNTIEKSVSTLPDTTAPTFGGANGITTLSATSITVTWTPATDDVTPSNQIVYLPYLATSAGGENFAAAVAPTAANATSYTFNGLTPNTPYYVVVRARDVAGNVDTNTVEKTISTQADATAPTFAGAASVGSATDQSLKVTWNAATDNSTPQANITYLVCKTQTSGGCNGAAFVASATIPNGGTNTTFTGLSPQQTYYFVVRAKDAYGNVDTNNVQVSGATIADLVAPTFAGLTAAASSSPTTIDLSWSAGSDDLSVPSQLVYDIYQSSTAAGESYAGATYTTSAGATSYQVKNLLPGQTWYFVVRARDQAGNHDTNVVEKSATVQNDTTAPTFGGVTSVTATGLTSLHAAWNAATDNVSPQASLVYYVCWATDASCTTAFTAKATTAAGATSYDITGLLANTSYTVVVRAHDQYNNTDANTKAITTATNADTTAPTFASAPQVTGATATTISLQWPAATDNYSPQSSLTYLLCYSTSNTACTGANFTANVTLVNQTTHTFTGLTNLQTYYFVVRAKDQAGNTDTNNNQVSAQTVTDTTPPTFAGLASAVVQSDSSIQLSWSAASDNVSTAGQIVYDVYQASSTGAESYAAATYTTSPGATGYLVTGLTPNTNYYFVVRARDAAGNRDTNTTEKTAKTAVDNVAPTFAGVTSVTVDSDSQLTAHWNAATDDTTPSGSIKYQVCWAVGTGCTTAFNAMATTGVGVTSYQTPVRTLAPATTYTFVVRAVDAYNNADTNVVTASNTTLADTVVPTFAGATSVTGVTYKTATVNWAAASDDYTTAANMSYAVCYTTSNGGCNDASFSAFTTVTNQLSYSFNALTPNTTYYFVVRAKDQAGNFNTVNNNIQVTTTTPQEANPPTFAGLTGIGSATSSSVQLTWNAASDDYSSATQITYNVYRATSSGAENYAAPYVTGIAGVAGVNTYTVTGLSAGTTYYFVVRAKDAAGNMDTNVVEKTLATLPTAPSFGTQPYSTGSTTSSLSFAWAASSTPATTISYAYCYSTTSGTCNNFVGGTSVGTLTSTTIGGLAAATTYYVRIKATNTGGTTYSNEVSATTPAIPPSLSGNVTCGTNKNYPTYVYATPPSATPGSYAVASYDFCLDTNGSSCYSVFNQSASTSVSNWIGAPASFLSFGNTNRGSVVNGPALTPNTSYYVYARARDTQGNLSGTVRTSGTCRSPVSYSQNVAPYFSTSCNTSGCHSPGPPGPWSYSYFNTNPTSGCGGKAYINTTTPSSSYLYIKVAGLAGMCGSQMPVGNPGYGASMILNWITDGERGDN